MFMLPPRLRVVIIAGVLLTGGWIGVRPTAAANEVTIVASTYPLAYFAERISGRPEVVQFPDIAGDPAYWAPSAADRQLLEHADVILLNGATYEQWTGLVQLPARRTFDTSAVFYEQYLTIEDALTHSHGSEGEHSHDRTASVTWLDLSLAIRQAEVVKYALQEAKVASEAELERNFEALRADLAALDATLREITAGRADVPLLAAQPMYAYLARRYQLKITSLLWTPESMPYPAMWQQLEALLREQPARGMLWHAQPLPQIAARLEQLGIRSIVFDPCANRPAQGNFLSIMQQNLENLQKIFGDS